MMRAGQEQVLLEQVCRIVCDTAGYCMAWVGYAQDDEGKSIQPAAWAGAEQGYLQLGGFSWADTVRGRGPSGLAIRSGQSARIDDFVIDPQAAPWRAAALQRGYRSSIAVPLKDEDGQAFGVLNIYARQPGVFSADETRLLEELAGNLAFGIAVLRSRHARRQAERHIALLGFALNNVHEGAFLIDENARLVYVNEAACRILGYGRDELLALGVADVDPDFPAVRWEDHWAELKAKGSLTFEGRHRTRQGTLFPVEINANYFERDGQGYNLALVRDIGQRKRIEHERLEHLWFFECMDRVHQVIQSTDDLELMMRDLLDALLEIFGSDRATLVYPCDPQADTWQVSMERTRPLFSAIFTPGTELPMSPEVADTFRAARAAGGPVKQGQGYERPIPAELAERFGDHVMLSAALYPKVGAPWELSLHQCSGPRTWTPQEELLFQEIGRRMADGLTSLLTQRDLRQSESALKEAQQLAQIGNWTWDEATDIKSGSDVYYQVLNLDPHADLSGFKAHLQIYTPESAERLAAAVQRAMQTGESYQLDLQLADTVHPTRWICARGQVRRDAGGRIIGLYGTTQNITERKSAEEALKCSEEFVRNILETVEEGFIVIDRDYNIISANRAFCSTMDLDGEQIQGRKCHMVTHKTHHPCFESGEDCPVQRALATGRRQAAVHIHTDGSGARQYVELRAYPVCDVSGAVVSVIETMNDVTEKRKLEEQLVQAQKLEAVGRLAGGVAHDFNNMLNVIIGHAELALDRLNPSRPEFVDLQEIRKAAERSADLTRQLLTFARRQTVVPKVLDLNATVQGMLKMLRRLIGEQIDLEWLPGQEMWPVKMDPSQIDQILANLCVNARDAIEDVGRITIETRTVTIDQTFKSDQPEFVPGQYVLLIVSDDGCGMDKETLGKLFEPFFTTKEMGKGTGLGLATVYGIVKQNNGLINVYSEPGQGSTFKIFLPRHADEPQPAGRPVSEVSTAQGHETILLVEDEAAILDLGRLILEKLGYSVLVAATPQQAIQLAEQHAGEVRLLITDVVLPEMNGRELADHVGTLCPGARWLFMSGYTGDVIAHHGVLDEGLNFLQKPFSIQDLAAKVREVLDGP
jgi:two-component system cell cycle sensor histidine kinase/response regulator CckA